MDVQKIQKALNTLGYGQIPVTGYYGDMTRKAVVAFQRANGLLDDGIAGPKTLAVLFPPEFSQEKFIEVSTDSIDLIVFSEITSELVYRRQHSRPHYPGAYSGVTIGIGYDLGYNTPQQIREDWCDLVDSKQLYRLIAVSQAKGKAAQSRVNIVRDINIPYSAAKQVFLERTLPRYAADALKAYPGLDQLHPDAAGAIVSLVFNRGTSFTGSTRIEMAALKPLIANKDYIRMAEKIRDMKRLWDGIAEPGVYEARLSGLLFRRDKEAEMIEGSASGRKVETQRLYI